MAIYHFSVSSVSRKVGRSAVKSSAYITGTRQIDERTGRVINYSRKAKEVLAIGAIGPVDWQATEAAEKRKDSKVARSIIVALPWELTLRALSKLVRTFGAWLRQEHGLAGQWVIHAAPGDPRNIHAHLLITTRTVNANGVHERKLRELDCARTSGGIVKRWRQKWEDAVNIALEKNGHEVRIDGRSHADAGREKIPRKHLGPRDAARNRKGYSSWAVRCNAAADVVENAKEELAKVARKIRVALTRKSRVRIQGQLKKARRRFLWVTDRLGMTTAIKSFPKEQPSAPSSNQEEQTTPTPTKTSHRR